MPAILQAQAPGRAGAGENGDLVQRVFARERRQNAHALRVRVDLLEHVVAEALVHEQPDQMRVGIERRAVRMVGGEEQAPRIVEQEERLQPDDPLQRVDEALVAVAHGHHAAPGVAFDIHDHRFFRVRALADGVLAHAVARGRAGLTEQHLAHVDGDVRRLVEELDDLRRSGRELAIPLRPIGVELDVGEVDRQSFRSTDRGERRLHVARHAEIAAVDVERMGDAELFQRAGEIDDDLPRRNAVIGVLLIEIELALVEFEGADAAGIDHFDRDGLGRVHGPGDIILDGLEILLLRELAQEKIVTAQHGEGAFVDHGRVAHLHMRLARIGRQHRGLEAGGVAHLGITIAGQMRRGHGMAAAGAGQLGAGDRIALMVLGQKHAGDGHLTAADMGMRVDGAGHDHLAAHVIGLVGLSVGHAGKDFAVLHIDVAHLARHLIRGIVDLAARQFDQHGRLQTYDVRGKVVMAGAIDPHTHIGGGKMTIARMLLPEDHQGDPVARTELTRAGCGHAVPSTHLTGYRYAEMGYTACFEPAMLPANARQAHMEMGDTPMVDKGAFVMLGSDDYFLRQLAAKKDFKAIKDYVAWTMHAAQAIAVKVVNPGGISAFKFNQRALDLDEEHVYYHVTPRQIIQTLARAIQELGVTHPLHIHGCNLGVPGNIESTLATVRASEGLRMHMTHTHFLSYGTEGDRKFSSGAARITELVNKTPNVSIDVGQVLFGQTCTASGDSMRQYAIGTSAHPKQTVVMEIECDAGRGVVPMRYRDKSF